LGERVFDLLVKRSALYEPQKIKIYRNALISELSNTFKYTDYEQFKREVIESIENEEKVLVDSDHLKALELLAMDERYFEYSLSSLVSIEFRERFIVDYLNVLDEQRDLLEIRKLQLFERFPELTSVVEPNANTRSIRLTLNEIISEEAYVYHFENLSKEFTLQIAQSIEKYMEIIENKLRIGRKILELLEKKISSLN
jgi:hypothetical protein